MWFVHPWISFYRTNLMELARSSRRLSKLRTISKLVSLDTDTPQTATTLECSGGLWWSALSCSVLVFCKCSSYEACSRLPEKTRLGHDCSLDYTTHLWIIRDNYNYNYLGNCIIIIVKSSSLFSLLFCTGSWLNVHVDVSTLFPSFAVWNRY